MSHITRTVFPVRQLLACFVMLLSAALPLHAWAVDTDSDTLPNDWEMANGRDPNVADYAINTGCIKDENGGVCTPSTNTAPVTIDYTTGSNPCPFTNSYRTELVPSPTGVNKRYTTSVYTVFSLGGGRYGCTGPTVTTTTTSLAVAELLVQFLVNGKDFCFLDSKGHHCYTYAGGTWTVSTSSMLIDSDHDGVYRPSDIDDLNALSDSDNDGIPDYIDADPLNAAVNTEKVLPVNDNYRGSNISEQNAVQ